MAKARPKTDTIPDTDSSANVHSPEPLPKGEVIPLPVNAHPLELRAADLFPSPLNPRRTPAGPEADAELEDSIVAKGLLQPMLARPARAPVGEARFEIICGNRRHAAVLSAIAKQRLPADWILYVSVRDVSDEDLIVLAGIENLERADMAPLDEAALFESLRPFIKARNPKADVGQEIAARLHISRRKVYSRLALLRLAPEAQAALRGGQLQLQEAAALTLGEPRKQREVLKEILRAPEPTDPEDNEQAIRREWRPDVDEIRRAMTAKKIPARFAGFDLALYTGERLVDPDTDEVWLTDLKQFDKLQRQAMAKRVEELKKKWPWVHVLENHGREAWKYRGPARQGDKHAGAIVYLERQGSITVTEGVLSEETMKERQAEAAASERKRAAANRAPGPKAAKRHLTDGQSIRAKHAKTQALRLGIAAHARVGLALGCLAFLEPDSELNVRTETGYHQLREENKFSTSKAEAELLEARCSAAGVAMRRASDYFSRPSSQKQADVLEALLKLKTERLLELYASLIATRAGDWFDSEHRIGSSPLACAIATAVGADAILPATWAIVPTEDHLKAHARDYLVRLAIGAKIPEPGELKKGELVKALLKQPPGTWTPAKFVESRFLPDAEMKKAFTAAAKGRPGKPAAKPKAAPKKAKGKKKGARR